jgi:hypothetical protein
MRTGDGPGLTRTFDSIASEIMFENRADIQPFLAETELGLFAAEIAGLCKPSV